MGRITRGTILFIGIFLFYSCNNTGKQKETNTTTVQNKIIQQSDGTISMKVDNAECYQDNANPSSNTAEWSVLVSKSGRFNVWLSSATKDTTDLKYDNSVMLSILDNRIEARPACDKIIRNSSDVAYPYFRADSFIGSLYIQDTGLFNIQIISEKIVTKEIRKAESLGSDNSKLLSVFLTPITQ